MWSHYCSGDGRPHNGIGLVFESDELCFSHEVGITPDGVLIANADTPHKVTYKRKYLSEDPLDRQLNAGSFLRTKFWPWSYEKEYRYIASKSGRYCYPANALKEIIFGLKLSASDRLELKTISESLYPHVKLSEVKLKKGDFDFEIVDL